MKKTKEKIFIGVAWPYVNGEMHIGHLAGYLLPADIVARYFRQKGHKVLMVSGSDCFGTPVLFEAIKKKTSTSSLVRIYHRKFLSPPEVTEIQRMLFIVNFNIVRKSFF